MLPSQFVPLFRPVTILWGRAGSCLLWDVSSGGKIASALLCISVCWSALQTVCWNRGAMRRNSYLCHSASNYGKKCAMLLNFPPVMWREVGGQFNFLIESLLAFFRSANLSTFYFPFSLVPRSIWWFNTEGKCAVPRVETTLHSLRAKLKVLVHFCCECEVN